MSEAAAFFQKLIEVLEGLKDDSKPKGKLSKTFTSVRTLKPFITEEEKQSRVFDNTSSAVDALRAEIMRGNWKEAASLLVYILKHGRHIEHFVWRLGLQIIWNHQETVADHMKEFLKVARNTSLYHHEIRLIGFILLINSGRYNDAKDLVLKMPRPSRARKHFPNSYMEHLAKMLQGYKGALEYIRWLESKPTIRPDGANHEDVDQSVTIVFAEKALKTLSPLFVNLSEASHLFLAVYLQLLSAKEGEAVAKTHALNISKARENDLAIQATVNSFFEQNCEVLARMVISSPGDTCAFDLARILLRGNCSDDSGNEDDDTPVSIDFDGKNASRALNVLANALDFPQNYTSVTGWSLFWQAIKKVCTIGTQNCAKEIHNVYEDRRSWWSTIHFVNGMNEAPNLRLLKASCCYILESEDHPYVQTALQNDAQKTLRTYITQIKPRKEDLDVKRGTCDENTPVPPAPILFYPDSESDTGTIVDETELEGLSESEMSLPKSAAGRPKEMPAYWDRRFRPKLNDFDVFTRLRKRLQLKKERRLARKTGTEDASTVDVSTVVFEHDVTLFSTGARSPNTTDEENLPEPEPVVRKRTVRKRKEVAKTVISKSTTRAKRGTADSDDDSETRPLRNNNSGVATSVVAMSQPSSPSPNLLALSPGPSLNGRELELEPSSSSTSDSDEDKMSLSILSDRSSYHTLPRTPAQKRPRRSLPELFTSESVSKPESESGNVSAVSDFDVTVQGRISNASTRASLRDSTSRAEAPGKNNDVYTFGSEDENPTSPIGSKRKSEKRADATLDKSFQATPDLFASQAVVEQNQSQFQYVVPETEDVGYGETGELDIRITNVRSELTQEEEKRVEEVVQNILQSRAKDGAPVLECQFSDEEGQEGKRDVKDWVSNLDILSFIEEDTENSQTTIKEEVYDETSLNLGVQELDTDSSKARELSGGEASLISTATPKKPELVQGNAIEAAPEDVKQQLFSKKSKRTGKLSTKSRKLKEIPEDEGEADRSESRIGRLQMSEDDDEPGNSSLLQTASEAGTVQAKAKKRNENTNSKQINDEVSRNEEASDDPIFQKDDERPVKKKKKSLASKYHFVSDSILEEVTERSCVEQSENAQEQLPIEAVKPDELESDVFVRPDSRQITIRSKTKKEARVRLYSEASSVTSVQGSVTSEQDRLNDSIESSASSMRKKKKKKKKKKHSTLAAPDNLQVSSSESVSTVDTMKENVAAVSNVEQQCSQMVSKKKKKKKKSKNKSGGSVGQEGTQGEKAVSVVSEESCMSLVPSETHKASGEPKAKKKKKKKKNKQITAEAQVGDQNNVNAMKHAESSCQSNIKPLQASSPLLIKEVGSPELKESLVKIQRNETTASKKPKKKSSDAAPLKTSEASEKPSGSANSKAISVATRAAKPEVEKDERNLESESVESDKGNDRKQGVVETSKASVDEPEEDDDFDAYISSFIKDFVANPNAPKRAKRSVERTASHVSSGTPTGEESSGSVTGTKKARRGTASTKVDKATKSQGSTSVSLDAVAPGSVSVRYPKSTSLNATESVEVAPVERKRKHREIESLGERAAQNVEKVAEKTVDAIEGTSLGKKPKVQLDDNQNGEKTHTDGVTSTESDDEDGTFVSMYVKNFLTNSGTPKQTKNAKVKMPARVTPKITAPKRGNSSVSDEIAVRHNEEVTSQNGGKVSPIIRTSSTLTMNTVESNSEQLVAEAVSPVKSTARSDSRKKAQPRVTSSEVGDPLEEVVQNGSHTEKHYNYAKRDQVSQQSEGHANPGLAVKGKMGTPLEDDDDDNVSDDFLSKYLKDYLTGIKQPTESKKETRKRKPDSVKKNPEVKQPTRKRAKSAVSVTSNPSVTKSVAVKSHEAESNHTAQEANVLGSADKPVDVAAPSSPQEKKTEVKAKKRSKQKDSTEVIESKVKKPTSPMGALSKRKANVKANEESRDCSSPTLETREDPTEGSGSSSRPEQEASNSTVGSANPLKKKSKRDKASSQLEGSGAKTDVSQADDSDGIDIKKATDLILQRCLARIKKN